MFGCFKQKLFLAKIEIRKEKPFSSFLSNLIERKRFANLILAYYRETL
jgi:hypothetical protein